MDILEKKNSFLLAPHETHSPSLSLTSLLSRDVMKLWGMLFLVGFTMQPFQNYLSPFIRDELLYPAEIARDAWVTMGRLACLLDLLWGWHPTDLESAMS
jgi:hypothetical protein